MKQVYRSFNKNTLDVYEVPNPTVKDGMVLINNVASIISVGTESMVQSFGDKNLFQKAKSRPDLFKQVIDKVKIDGLVQTINTSKSNLDQPIALGYSSAGIVIETAADIHDINVADVGDRRNFPGSLNLPDHLVFGGVSQLTTLLKNAGFEVVTVRSLPIDGFIYSIKNFVKWLIGKPVYLGLPYCSPTRTLWIRAKLLNKEDV